MSGKNTFLGRVAAGDDMAVQALSVNEIRDLNSHPVRPGLKEDGYYLKVFVMNDKLTTSAPWEGGPFKIAGASIGPMAASVVGRPFIVGPDPRKHVRGARSDPEEIIKVQQKWAIGEFVRHVINPLSNNAYGIVEVFKEFVDEIKKGMIRGRPLPKYASPLIAALSSNRDGEITDGRILHVQAVDTPGYSSDVAKIVGTCQGMLGECMNKLRHLGAAGNLRAWQEKLVTGIDDIDVFADDFDERVAAYLARGPDTIKTFGATDDEDDPAEDFEKAVADVVKFARKSEIERRRDSINELEQLMGGSGSDQQADYAGVFESIGSQNYSESDPPAVLRLDHHKELDYMKAFELASYGCD